MSEKSNPYCNCLYFSVNALSRSVTKLAEEEFAVTGLSPSYAFVMMSVNNSKGIQAGQLAQEMMLTPSTITRLVEKLELKGLLRKENDGRATIIYSTEKGKNLQELILTAWSNFHQKYNQLLGEDFSRKLTGNIYDAVIKVETV